MTSNADRQTLDTSDENWTYDCTKGPIYNEFEDAILNEAAGKVDERGYSDADHIMGLDEGGAAVGAPALQVAAAEPTAAEPTRAATRSE